MKPNNLIAKALLAAAPPLLTVLAGSGAMVFAPHTRLQGALWVILFASGCVSAVEAVLLYLWAVRSKTGAEGWTRETEDLEALVKVRDLEIARLRGEVEILTAAREIGLIANADDDFEDVLGKVLDLVGESLKAEELVLFLIDAASKALEPVARRRDRKVSFRKGMKTPPISMVNVEEALVHGRMLEAAEWNGYSFALPLVVEREVVGVLKAVLSDQRAAMKDSPRAEEARRLLKGIEKHVALAIKTPSLYNRAVLDGLTGLFTRRHFDSQAEGFFHMAARRKTALSLILSDIDHFKKINDTHGHQAGDRVLRGVSKVISREIRKYDSAYRYGGEELCVLLPETETEGARLIAERIRSRVEESDFRNDRRERVPVTISLGVASHAPWMTGPGQLIESADQALYKAKDSGRNRVECAPGTPPAAAGRPGGETGAVKGGKKTQGPRRRARKKKP